MFARVKVLFEPMEDRSADVIVLDRFFGEGALPDELKAAALELGYLTAEQFDEWVQPAQMTRPG